MIKELACYFLSSQNHRMFLFYSQPPLNGEIIPFFPPLFPLELSWWRPRFKPISNACTTHVFIGNASRLSSSLILELRPVTTLCSRRYTQATIFAFTISRRSAVRDPETGVQRIVRQIDNSEWFSKDNEGISLRRQTIFTLQVCFHSPDKRYLPIIIIIIIARLDFACAFSRSIRFRCATLYCKERITMSTGYMIFRPILRFVSMYNTVSS